MSIYSLNNFSQGVFILHSICLHLEKEKSMLKLFRNIRYDLLAKNKTGKYLNYAIGEITLVVIGILIALQLNAWRGEKKDRQIEQAILMNISKDLERDLQELRNVKDFKISQNEASLRLMEYLIDASIPVEDTAKFFNDLHLMIYFVIPSANRTSYDLATSTGYLNNITSDKLLTELSNYFTSISLEQHVTDTKRFINAFTESYLIGNYALFSKHVQALDGKGGKYALERYRNDSRPILQLDDIRNDLSLENYLNILSIRLTIGIKGLESEEEWVQSLIQNIESHLN